MLQHVRSRQQTQGPKNGITAPLESTIPRYADVSATPLQRKLAKSPMPSRLCKACRKKLHGSSKEQLGRTTSHRSNVQPLFSGGGVWCLRGGASAPLVRHAPLARALLIPGCSAKLMRSVAEPRHQDRDFTSAGQFQQRLRMRMAIAQRAGQLQHTSLHRCSHTQTATFAVAVASLWLRLALPLFPSV